MRLSQARFRVRMRILAAHRLLSTAIPVTRYLCEHCKEEIGKQKFSSEDDEQVKGKNPGRPAIYWPIPFVFGCIQSRGHAVTPAITRTDSEGSQDCRPDPVH